MATIAQVTTMKPRQDRGDGNGGFHFTLCEQYTHKYSTYRVAQHDHISSREHAWLKSWKAQDCTYLCHKTIVIHVSCLIPCRTCHSASPTHKTYGPRPIKTLRCAEWRINTNPISHTLREPCACLCRLGGVCEEPLRLEVLKDFSASRHERAGS